MNPRTVLLEIIAYALVMRTPEADDEPKKTIKWAGKAARILIAGAGLMALFMILLTVLMSEMMKGKEEKNTE